MTPRLSFLHKRHVEIIDGLPYAKPDYWSWQGERRSLSEDYGTKFYVHPETGLLCMASKICCRREPKPPIEIIWMNDYEQYRQIDSLWYRITFEPLRIAFIRDVLLKETIDAKKAVQIYGRKIYAANKRQCGKRELKKIRENLA